MFIGVSLIEIDGEERGIKVIDTDTCVSKTMYIDDIVNNNIEIENMYIKDNKIYCKVGRKEDYPVIMQRDLRNKDNVYVVGYYRSTMNNERVFVVSNHKGSIKTIYESELLNSKLINSSINNNSIEITDDMINLDDYNLECTIVGRGYYLGGRNSVDIDVVKDTLEIDCKETNIENIEEIELTESIYKFRIRKIILRDCSIGDYVTGVFNGVKEIQLEGRAEFTWKNGRLFSKLEKIILNNVHAKAVYIDRELKKLEGLEVKGKSSIQRLTIGNKRFNMKDLFRNSNLIIGRLVMQNNGSIEELEIHEGYKIFNMANIECCKKLKKLIIMGKTTLYGNGFFDGKIDIECPYDYPYRDLEGKSWVNEIIRREPTEKDKEILESTKYKKACIMYSNIEKYRVIDDLDTIKTILNVTGVEPILDAMDRMTSEEYRIVPNTLVGKYGYFFEVGRFENRCDIVTRCELVKDLGDYKIYRVDGRNECERLSHVRSMLYIVPCRLDDVKRNLIEDTGGVVIKSKIVKIDGGREIESIKETYRNGKRAIDIKLVCGKNEYRYIMVDIEDKRGDR